MTTNSNNQPSRTKLLINVRDCAKASGKADVNVANAIRDAGGNQDDVKEAYRIGRVMGTLNVTVEVARKIVTKMAAPATAKSGELSSRYVGRRSDAQQAAVRAADKGWSRALAQAGIKVDSKKAGNVNAKRKGTKAKASTPANVIKLGPLTVTKGTGKQPAVATFKTTAEGVQAFEALAANALLLSNKNISHLPGDIRQAVSTFHTAIMNAIKAEREAK